MRIGLLSDTHGFLDPAVFEYFSECEEIWHAGDLGTPDILERLREFRPVRAVVGNIDGAPLRKELKRDLEWECLGVRVYMTHIGGYPGNYDRRARRELLKRRPGLFVSGHSHILRVLRDAELGLIYMNPGAAGHQGWHKVRTILRFTIDAGRITAAEAIELGTRGRGAL
jgi:putative phosphoesterase